MVLPPLFLVAVLGLVVGSFLNVVVARVPVGESVVAPRSRCPGCGTEIRPKDNIPILSWMILRARCRDCGTPISARYPLVELLTAVVFVLITWSIGVHADLPAFLYLGALGVALAAIDLDTKRLPNVLTLSAYPVALVLLTLAAAVDDAWDDLLRGLAGMVLLFAFYFVLMLVKSNGMGFGDVKLSGVLGLYLGWLGWATLAAGAFLGFVLGAAVSIPLMISGRATRKSQVPFGPFMLAGVLLAILVGPWLVDQYRSLTGI